VWPDQISSNLQVTSASGAIALAESLFEQFGNEESSLNVKVNGIEAQVRIIRVAHLPPEVRCVPNLWGESFSLLSKARGWFVWELRLAG
jgi:hypothetical protein